ncbi:MAG: hypothetical protein KME50_22745 [Nostoc desertorum CM1-VF14]|nr:hypothetical protein [Nostoc desertorum CM1-VF14]
MLDGQGHSDDQTVVLISKIRLSFGRRLTDLGKELVFLVSKPNALTAIAER